MSPSSKIKHIVQFTELTSVYKEEADNSVYNIYKEETKTNKAYCQAVIDKIFNLPYAKLPEFFSHHCIFLADPIKWLNKFEKLISENEELFTTSGNQGRMIKCYTIIESKRKEIEQTGYKHTAAKLPMMYVNAECEERYFSFKETKKKVHLAGSYTDKIMFLTKEKFDYEQASIDFINPKLPDYSTQCQKEIDQIQHINRLTNEFSLDVSQSNIGIMPHNKLKINCNINQLVDVYYQLHRELFTDGKPIIDGHINDITAVIVNSFVDKDGRELSPQTIRTLLTPSRTDKRPKPHKRIDIDKLL
ncbi:hypothetical protein G6R40_02455 [Chryseobacterium sp. POL2]|uniref:hypothetical protein n=1 Tax=Chryseobacterium sp. POL2 TaxID=2713414 RepID=UPI0013E0F68C|nr:hypothetical protein [Chryseobacterium sp. POL2]QIG88506.1 hypothetical protein G6R40_02005 [Chryseobacterium sp. POL2]QIG88593.1 hypothetical protein G6R40_02455 [Chryseobacterium sp. POL2]